MIKTGRYDQTPDVKDYVLLVAPLKLRIKCTYFFPVQNTQLLENRTSPTEHQTLIANRCCERIIEIIELF